MFSVIDLENSLWSLSTNEMQYLTLMHMHSMHILNTVPYTFPRLLKRRMRLYIESLFSR